MKKKLKEPLPPRKGNRDDVQDFTPMIGGFGNPAEKDIKEVGEWIAAYKTRQTRKKSKRSKAIAK